MKFLVVGCGSIGRRHIENLRSIGAGEILAFDVAPESLEAVKGLGVATFGNLDEALAQKPDAVLVCTPSHLHLGPALKAVETGAHVLIEKPIAEKPDGIRELLSAARKKKLRMAVGYNLRFDRGLRIVKEVVDSGRLGRVLSARVSFGQYLPDWRPGQDYRRSYSAKRAEGGGAILDVSHEIDYARWLLGDVADVTCVAGKVSDLEMDAEDLAEITLKFSSGAVAHLHLDFLRRDYHRGCELICERGTIVWEFGKAVRIFDAASKNWETREFAWEKNQMYVDELKSFIDLVSGRPAQNATAADGAEVLKIALAARKSAETGKRVRLKRAGPKA